MFTLPVRSKVITGPRWGCARPWSLITDMGPYPALFHAFAQPLVAPRPVQNPYRRVICVQQIARHNMRFNPFHDRLQDLHRPPAPIYKRAIRNVSAHAGEDFILAVKRKMIVEP